jgi:hypothetical protein
MTSEQVTARLGERPWFTACLGQFGHFDRSAYRGSELSVTYEWGKVIKVEKLKPSQSR